MQDRNTPDRLVEGIDDEPEVAAVGIVAELLVNVGDLGAEVLHQPRALVQPGPVRLGVHQNGTASPVDVVARERGAAGRRSVGSVTNTVKA